MISQVDYAATGQEALSRIAAARDLDALEGLRVEFLGKQGSISALLKTLGGMSPEQRREFRERWSRMTPEQRQQWLREHPAQESPR